MARIDLPTQIRKSLDPTPLYALAGVSDLAVEKLSKVPGLLAELRTEVPAVVTAQRNALLDSTARVVDLPVQALALPLRLDAKRVELATVAGETYDALAKRGAAVVTRIRKQEETQEVVEQANRTVARVKDSASTVRKSAARTRKSAASTTEQARKTADAAVKAAEAGADKLG